MEIVRLRREVAELKAEGDILKKAAAYSRRIRHEVRFKCEAPGELGSLAPADAPLVDAGKLLRQPGPPRSETGGFQNTRWK